MTDLRAHERTHPRPSRAIERARAAAAAAHSPRRQLAALIALAGLLALTGAAAGSHIGTDVKPARIIAADL